MQVQFKICIKNKEKKVSKLLGSIRIVLTKSFQAEKLNKSSYQMTCLTYRHRRQSFLLFILIIQDKKL